MILKLFDYSVAPGKPANFSADAVGGTWIHFGWQLPKHPNIDRHIITTTRITQNIVTMDDTMSSVTSWNMTGLLPKVMYSFRVQAVAAAFGLEIMGLFSDVITVTTLVNGKNTGGQSVKPWENVNPFLLVSALSL